MPTDERLRMTLRQLEVFVATARHGSTRAGGERVSRSQSAASSALAELEAALGAQLFDRQGRRLILNENGRAFLPQAMALLDQAHELQHLFSGAHAAPLRMAASLTIGEYLLPPLVASWRRAHAHSPVQLRIANTSEVIRAVVTMEADLGFIEGPQTHPDLEVQPWLEDELLIVASPTHPLAQGRVGLRQLGLADWILREPGSGTRQAADAWLLPALGTLRLAYELGSTEAIKQLAAAGAGLACLSRHAVTAELARGGLVVVQTRLPRARRRLAIVTRRGRTLGHAAMGFMRLAVAAQERRFKRP